MSSTTSNTPPVALQATTNEESVSESASSSTKKKPNTESSVQGTASNTSTKLRSVVEVGDSPSKIQNQTECSSKSKDQHTAFDTESKNQTECSSKSKDQHTAFDTESKNQTECSSISKDQHTAFDTESKNQTECSSISKDQHTAFDTESKNKTKNRRTLNKIKFFQLNCNRSSYVNRELLLEIEYSKAKSFIACLLEPGNTYRSKDGLEKQPDLGNRTYRITGCPPGSTFYTPSPNDGPPRSVIFADKDQNLVLDSEFSDRDVTTCRWLVQLPDDEPAKRNKDVDGNRTTKPTNVYLCALYWDINKDIPPKPFMDLLNYATDKNIPVIIMSDSNAHSFMWYSKDENERGHTLEDLILLNELTVLNDSNVPTFDTFRGQSCIDVTLVSNKIAQHFQKWKVCSRDLGSDHKLITFQLNTTVPCPPLRRNLRKCDWTTFVCNVDEELTDLTIPKFWNVTTIDNQVQKLYSAINTALDAACPKTMSVNHHRLPWWNDDIAVTRKARNRAQNKYLKKRNRRNHEALLARNRENRRNMRKASRKHWQQTTTETEDTAGMAKLVRGIRRGEIIPPTLVRKDDTFTKTRKETATVLLETHFPKCETEGPETMETVWENFSKHSMITEVLDYLDPFKVRLAINTFSDFKAAGPDEIKPIILKHLPQSAINMLSCIYTACIILGYTPKEWQKSRTVFIPKPGKTDYTQPRSYRPISLSSFCFKAFERLILWRLETTTFKRHPLHVQQHAFRKGRSTEGPLTQLTTYVERAFQDKGIAIATFIDIEGAFDNLSTDVAIKAMENHHIPPDITKWYTHYLRNRRSSVSIGNKQIHRRIIKGTPQGGVLSPVLWNMAFDSLLKLFDNDFVSILGFADDACLIIRGHHNVTLQLLMQEALLKVQNWATGAGLKLSTHKTVAMIFARSHVDYTDTTNNLRLYNREIEYVNEVKYLGITFDHKLKWNIHLAKKTKHATQLFFLLRNALGVMWGPRPHLIKWIYTGMMRPALTYGSFIWGKTTNKVHWQLRFRRINALILRMMCPQRKSTPISGMELITYIPPINLFIEGEIIKSYMRNRHLFPDTLIRPRGGHLEHAEQLIDEYQIPKHTIWDRGPSVFCFNKKYSIDNSTFDHGTPIKTSNALVAYTDGSKINEGVGSGAIILYYGNEDDAPDILQRNSYKLNRDLTVFQAEVAAIQETATLLLQIKDSFPLPSNVYILSDSMSALQALSRYETKSIQINNCMRTLNILGNLTTVTLRWVKAHSNHFWNERADELAKAGAADTLLDNPYGDTFRNIKLYNIPKPFSLLKSKVSEKMEERWEKRFLAERNPNGTEKHRQTKLFITKPDKGKSKALLKLNREQLGRVFQFVTGHARLNRHEAIVQHGQGNFQFTPNCRLCDQGEETPFHLVHECDPLENESWVYFQAPKPCDINDIQSYTTSWKVSNMVAFLHHVKIDKLFRPEDEEPPDEFSQQTNVTMASDEDDPEAIGSEV